MTEGMSEGVPAGEETPAVELTKEQVWKEMGKLEDAISNMRDLYAYYNDYDWLMQGPRDKETANRVELDIEKATKKLDTMRIQWNGMPDPEK